jgi:hypothetical protein
MVSLAVLFRIYVIFVLVGYGGYQESQNWYKILFLRNQAGVN